MAFEQEDADAANKVRINAWMKEMSSTMGSALETEKIAR